MPTLWFATTLLKVPCNKSVDHHTITGTLRSLAPVSSVRLELREHGLRIPRVRATAQYERVGRTC